MVKPVLMEVVEVHLDEAEWLWTQWERALHAPDLDMEDTARLEERLLAHVDGLVEGGGAVAETLLWPALELEEPARVFAASLALLEAGEPVQQARTLLLGTGHVQRPALQRAMELSGGNGLAEALLPLLDHDDVGLQAAALEVLVFREEAPQSALSRFLTHEEPRLRISALHGLSVPRRLDPRGLLSSALASPHAGVQEAAIEAGLRWGHREAWECCRQAVSQSRGRASLVLWAMGGSEEDMGLLMGLLRVPEHREDALWALGFSGRICAAEACLDWMGDTRVSRLAGESFSSITGLRLEGHLALSKEASPDETVPLEDDLEADLVPRPEDDLPRPDAQAVAAWWREARGGFERGARYLMGHPLNGDSLLTALERGPMRRRHVWARELAIRSHGACHVTTRALARRQRTQLGRARTLGAHFSQAPLARLLTR